MSSICRAVLFLLAVIFLSTANAHAQELNGTITGTVVDASGAPVANVAISITALDRKIQVRATKTDAKGDYSAPQLTVGKYSVAAEATGFKTSVKKDITLNASDSLTIDFKLEVGDVKETVTVEAAPLQVQLQHGAVQSQTINGTQIRELALVTRNYEQLVQLMPGVSSASVDQLYVGNSLPSGQTATIPFAINGARNSMNAWLVDGADNIDRGSNQTLLNTPSVDAIAEFTVQRSGFSAESGRAGGAMIQVVTKSGTSQIHGDAYEFIRNNDFAANNFYNNATLQNLNASGQAQVPPLHYNDFGWTLGGPLFIPKIYNKDKNKTFFFFSEEFRRVIQYASGTATLPTTAELNGTFPAAICSSYTGSVCNTTTTQLTTIDPVAKEYIKDIFSKLPAPNAANTLVSQFRNVYNFEQELYKIDHVFGPKLSVSARFLRDQIPTTEPQGLFTGSPVPGVPVTNTNSPGHQWTFKGLSSFTPTLINEIGYNYSFGAIISNPTGLINSNISTDIKTTLPFPVTLSEVPGLSFTGGTSITGYGPYRDYNRDYNVFDNLTKIWNEHTFKFGATYNRYQKTENAAGANAGSFAFTSASSTTPSGASLFSQAFANFLTGNVATFSQTSLDVTPDIRANQFEIYAQDSWRLRPNLTVDYGVRYSNFRQPIDAKHELTNFDPAAFSASQVPTLTAGGLLSINAQNYLNGIIIGGQNSPFGTKVSNQANNNFAPRLGFAWDPFGKQKTSIRGGYGIFYDATLYGSFEQNIFANPPFVNAVSISNVTLDDPAGGSINVSNTPKALHGTPINFQTPYMQQWSFEIDHQLNPSTLFTAAYVGTKGTHLLGYIDLNQLPPNYAYTSGYIPTTTNFTSTASELPLNNLRPYPGYNAINSLETWFNSNYNALQTTVQKRFRGESQISANYTWSKNLTDNGSDRSNAPQSTYYFNKGEYGPATYDRTHIFNLNFVYLLPFYRDQKGLIGKTVGGFQVSAIAQYNTGLAYTVTTSSSDPAAVGLLGSSASSGRPDLLCNPYNGWTSTRTSWFNTTCFVNPAAGQHHLGDEGRGVLRGPGYEGWSIALSKSVTFGQESHYRFVLRGEASNAFNHTNPSTFGSLNNTSSLFGTITGYRDPRIIQLSGKFYF
jgi:outer membrane receptor protein involved in Fe transport